MSTNLDIPTLKELSDRMVLALRYNLYIETEIIQYDEDVSQYTLSHTKISESITPELTAIVNEVYTELVYDSDFTISDDILTFTVDGEKPDTETYFRVTYWFNHTGGKITKIDDGSVVKSFIDVFANEVRRLYLYANDTLEQLDYETADLEYLQEMLKVYLGTVTVKGAEASSGYIIANNDTGGDVDITLGGDSPSTFTTIAGVEFEAVNILSEENEELIVAITDGIQRGIHVQCKTTGTSTNIEEVDWQGYNGLTISNPRDVEGELDLWNDALPSTRNYFAGGSDGETANQLRERYRDALFSFQGVSKEAIIQSLKKIDGVYRVAITTSGDVEGADIPYKEYWVTCFDADDSVITANNERIYAEISRTLDDKSPIGIEWVYVDSVDNVTNVNFGVTGTDTTVNVYYNSLTIWCASNQTYNIRAFAEERINNYINALPIGGTIEISQLIEIIMNISCVTKVEILGDTGASNPYWNSKTAATTRFFKLNSFYPQVIPDR